MFTALEQCQEAVEISSEDHVIQVSFGIQTVHPTGLWLHLSKLFLFKSTFFKDRPLENSEWPETKVKRYDIMMLSPWLYDYIYCSVCF